jgi:hypothetical protein
LPTNHRRPEPDNKTQNIQMAGHPAGFAVFDLSREALLNYSLPPFNAGADVSRSSTISSNRLRWNQLFLWNDFEQWVINYWNTQPQVDKIALVAQYSTVTTIYNEVVHNGAFLTEDDVKTAINEYPLRYHNVAAIGQSRAPLPSDQHSKLVRCSQGAGQLGLASVPDFAMQSMTARTTVLMEVKTPWLVTPEQIDAVIDGKFLICIYAHSLGRAHPAGVHSGRLAVEQLYGYMVRNAKTLGIISTLKGWCFLYRQDGGILYMTRMFGDFLPLDGVTQGAAAEGYYPTPNWTIMKALYYMSNLGETIPDTAETTNGQPGRVDIPFADPTRSEAAPRIRIVRDLRDRRLEPRPADDYYYGGYQAAHAAVGMVQFHEGVDYTSLLFEPWKVENQLGPINWIAHVISDQSKVVLKLWDGWKVDTEERDREAEVYVRLRPLWGKYVPSLRVATPFDYMHALIIEYIDVNPSSSLC